MYLLYSGYENVDRRFFTTENWKIQMVFSQGDRTLSRLSNRLEHLSRTGGDEVLFCVDALPACFELPVFVADDRWLSMTEKSLRIRHESWPMAGR